MAEKRKVVLTKLANEHITHIYQALLEIDSGEAEALMDDFLDTVFGDIPAFPEQFPICEGIKTQSNDYRIAHLIGHFRVIFQILKDRVLILLILHESELPF